MLFRSGAYKAAWVATGANAAAYDDTFYVEPWASIVSLADAKAFLNITTSTNDEEIRSFVLAATTMVEEYTNRAFVSRSMTRRYSGLTGTDRINAPVGMTAVATVVENGVTLTPTVDYDLDPISVVLYRRSGTYYTRYWLPGILNISITGTVGSNTIPADVRHATLLLIEHLWDTQRGGMTTVLGQESADEYNPQASYSMPRRVAEILDNYQIPSIA